MRRTLVAIAAAIAMAFALPTAPTQARFLWHPDAVGDTPTPDLAGDLTGVRLSTFRDAGIKMLRAYADFADPMADYHVVFLFDSRRGDRADYKLRVSRDIASGGIYHLELLRLSDHERVEVRIYTSGKALLRLPVWFDMGVLDRTKHIRWRVVTWFRARYDQAPEAGWFGHCRHHGDGLPGPRDSPCSSTRPRTKGAGSLGNRPLVRATDGTDPRDSRRSAEQGPLR